MMEDDKTVIDSEEKIEAPRVCKHELDPRTVKGKGLRTWGACRFCGGTLYRVPRSVSFPGTRESPKVHMSKKERLAMRKATTKLIQVKGREQDLVDDYRAKKGIFSGDKENA